MSDRGMVVWAPDPFTNNGGNPRPWMIVSTDRMPYSDEESIGVALTTQSHHPGSFSVPSEAWRTGEPNTPSHVLPWTLATLKDDLHVVGVQGEITDEFVQRVVSETITYLDSAAARS